MNDRTHFTESVSQSEIKLAVQPLHPPELLGWSSSQMNKQKTTRGLNQICSSNRGAAEPSSISIHSWFSKTDTYSNEGCHWKGKPGRVINSVQPPGTEKAAAYQATQKNEILLLPGPWSPSWTNVHEFGKVTHGYRPLLSYGSIIPSWD